ncbi:uncharacterized protein LOC129694834 [Leucoraja erinacea]|uniref:uncharacterized protein LOC129694834 n=1 Tax=Leucoraja erinaceus TaxID=7782 RepID=UPI00245874AF|nr:uncharacterized protein LOC129694834 [Leucoraja erinacea]
MAASINHLSNKPLQEKVLAQVLEEHTAPDNCEALKVKSLNSQIWGNVGGPIRAQEVKLQRILRLLTSAITAYARCVQTEEMSTHQQDVLALMCTTQFELNNLRRENIRPALNPKFAGLCKTPSMESDSLLFGNNLNKQLKDMEEASKTFSLMRSGNITLGLLANDNTASVLANDAEGRPIAGDVHILLLSEHDVRRALTQESARRAVDPDGISGRRVLSRWKNQQKEMVVATAITKFIGHLNKFMGCGLLLTEIVLYDRKTKPCRALLQTLGLMMESEGKERSGSEYRKLLHNHGFTNVHIKHTGTILDVIFCTKQKFLSQKLTQIPCRAPSTHAKPSLPPGLCWKFCCIHFVNMVTKSLLLLAALWTTIVNAETMEEIIKRNPPRNISISHGSLGEYTVSWEGNCTCTEGMKYELNYSYLDSKDPEMKYFVKEHQEKRDLELHRGLHARVRLRNGTITSNWTERTFNLSGELFASVDNLTCIFYGKLYMNCSWDVTEHASEGAQFNLSYRERNPSPVYNCTDYLVDGGRNIGCVNENIRIEDTIEIIICISEVNKKDKLPYCRIVNPYHFFKLDSPINVMIDKSTDEVKWTLPKFDLNTNCYMFQLNCTNLNDGNTKVSKCLLYPRCGNLTMISYSSTRYLCCLGVGIRIRSGTVEQR